MAELLISYNPFTVETKLHIKENGDWVQIQEKSGLLKVCNTRLQRWLFSPTCNVFFDELINAVGDDSIDIFFSGTEEDMKDFKQAVDSFVEEKHDVDIHLCAYGSMNNNSSVSKRQRLNGIINEAKKSRYKNLIRKEIWKLFDDILSAKKDYARIIDFTAWGNYRENIFSKNAYSLICFNFSYEQINQKDFRKALYAFEKEMDSLEDRRFDRDRFVFLCTYRIEQNNQRNRIKKLFTEYGIQDLNYYLISEMDFELLKNDDVEALKEEHRIKDIVSCIQVYNDRYSEQYRLRLLLQDDILELLKQSGYDKSPKQLRIVDKKLRENSNAKITDKDVKAANAWICNLIDQLESLLDLGI